MLLRGGIAIGSVCHNKKEIFGPAMVNAYQLESKHAIYPRIILSENVINLAGEFHQSHHHPEEEIDHVKSLLKQDEDGYYFIDYFE